jgi:hypothetical protein
MATPDRLPSTMPTMVPVDSPVACSADTGSGGKGALEMGSLAVSMGVEDVPMESCVGESANTDEAGYAVFIDTEVECESGSRGFAMNDRLCNDGVLVSKPGVSFATLSAERKRIAFVAIRQWVYERSRHADYYLA